MPTLLDRMPFPALPDELVIRGERVRIRADQIIIWVSLSPRRMAEQHPLTDPFPAILDTGHSHHFAMTRRQLIEWGGLDPDLLPIHAAVRDRGQKVPLREANVWVHLNTPGRRDQLADRPPQFVRTRPGIAVYPEGDFPRLPILGLRVIAENNLILNVDGPRREASLRTAPRWRVLG